jgi:hypothetical protein
MASRSLHEPVDFDDACWFLGDIFKFFLGDLDRRDLLGMFSLDNRAQPSLAKRARLPRRSPSGEGRLRVAQPRRTANTETPGRFCVKRSGPSHRRMRNASVVLKNFVDQQKKTSSTISAIADVDPGSSSFFRDRSDFSSDLSPKTS